MSHKKKGSTHRLISDAQPTATNVDWPVFVPNEDGSTDVEVGRARLRYGTLVVEFKKTVAAVAIQNMIERGVLLGFGMIMLKPDVVNEMYQEVVAEEEAEAEKVADALVDAIVTEAREEERSHVTSYPVENEIHNPEISQGEISEEVNENNEEN